MQELVYPKEQKVKFDLFFIGMCLLILLSVFNTSQYGATLSWILVPIGLLIVGRLLTRDFGVRISTLLILLFYAVFCISTAISPLVEIKRDVFTFGILCLAYMTATSYRYSTVQVKFLLNAYVVSAVVVSLFILLAWVTGDYYSDWHQRASFKFLGVYKDPNYVMAYVVPTIVITVFKIIKNQDKKQRMINVAACVVLITAMLATGSRSALLAFVFALLVMLAFMNIDASKKVKLFISIGAVGVLTVIIVFAVIPSHVTDRLFSLDSGGRFELWGAALTAFLDYPVLGGGMNAASMQASLAAGLGSHNVYLDILCGSGIVGSLLFIVFFVTSCCRCRKQNRGFLYGMVVASMMPMFFINGFNTVTFYLPLILLTVLSIYCNMSHSDLSEIL